MESMESMESQEAGFPPFPHSLEIPSGLGHDRQEPYENYRKSERRSDVYPGKERLTIDTLEVIREGGRMPGIRPKRITNQGPLWFCHIASSRCANRRVKKNAFSDARQHLEAYIRARSFASPDKTLAVRFLVTHWVSVKVIVRQILHDSEQLRACQVIEYT
jgi:hypothetical protein